MEMENIKKNKIKSGLLLGLIFTSCAYFSFALAQSGAFYQSNESFSNQTSYGGDCFGCSQGYSSGSEVYGTVGAAPNDADLVGEISANVVSPTAGGGGGGGGGVVSAPSIPLAQQYQYATPTSQGEGGGYEPATTSQAVPTLPNTALGDDQKLFYILLAGLALFSEILILAFSRTKKKLN